MIRVTLITKLYDKKMKKRIFGTLCLLLVAFAMGACKNEKVISTNEEQNENEGGSFDMNNLTEGATMPNVVVDTNKGSKFDLSKAEKPVLINFWATWCPPCRGEMPGLQSLYEEYQSKIDFVMINIGETKETVEEFLKENKIYTFPIGYDSDMALANSFKIMSIPTTFIVGKDKKIKNFIIGARAESDFKEFIENVINE